MLKKYTKSAFNLKPGENLRARRYYLELSLFVSIVSGPPSEGGGIYGWFTFLWSVGNRELAYLSAELILTPFDFSPR